MLYLWLVIKNTCILSQIDFFLLLNTFFLKCKKNTFCVNFHHFFLTIGSFYNFLIGIDSSTFKQQSEFNQRDVACPINECKTKYSHHRFQVSCQQNTRNNINNVSAIRTLYQTKQLEISYEDCGFYR